MDDEIDRLAKRLARAARKTIDAAKQRDRLIGELYAEGMSLEEIARHAKLAHAVVRETLIRDGQLDD